jgi:uncharacterized protein YybS (DUF2232 family)
MNYKAVLIATIQTVGLFAAGLIIPILGQVLAFFTPVPIMLVSALNSRREGLAVLIASTALSALLGGWEMSLIFFFSFGLMATGTAEGTRRGMKPEQIALIGGLLPAVVIAIMLSFYFIRIGRNPLEYTEAFLRSSITEAAKLYTSMGMTEMASMAASIPDKFIFYLVRLIPGLTVATSLAQAACCYGMSRSILARKHKILSPSGPPFSLWHAPDSWIWGLILSLAFIIVPHETVKLVGWNLAILFAVVYLAQGSAIVDFYLRKARFKPFMRGLVIGLLLALPAIIFIVALGIVDIWADVRKVRGPVQP